MKKTTLLCLILLGLATQLVAQDKPVFQSENFDKTTPWSHLNFYNKPENFQFAIVTDRTGGHRVGVFEKAVDKLNLLMPEFVVSVGDLIEGYTKDSTEVNRQWDEFNSFIARLEPPFFYVPGNHDFSNEMMKNQWLARYGRDYYYFIYKDVLFILMNTNDGDGASFSADQVKYVKSVLEKHKNVKWTLFFMHHPLWAYEDRDQFLEMEQLIGNRPYTVFAGHNHMYLQSLRNNHNYYILGTTGGGSRLRGPRFGEYDHISWVTMTDQGPKIINLGLDGMFDHDISNEKTQELVQNLIKNTQFDHLTLLEQKPVVNATKELTSNTSFTGGIVKILFKNSSDQPLRLTAHFYHHHTLSPSLIKTDTLIAPNTVYQMEVQVKPLKELSLNNLTPLELDWKLAYETDKNDVPFYLEGSQLIHLFEQPKLIQLSQNPVFLNNTEVKIENPYLETKLKYTLDGSEPTLDSPEYREPIRLTNTTQLKIRLFDNQKNPLASPTIEKTYTKASLIPALTPKTTQTGLKYAYYEGNFEVLPDFTTLKPLKTGAATSFVPENLAQRPDHFALLFEGFVEVPEDGLYTFYLRSDDGAKLFIANQQVVDNDGSHSAQTKKGLIALKKGKHPIRIQYFEDFQGEELSLGWESTQLKRQEIPMDKFSH